MSVPHPAGGAFEVFKEQLARCSTDGERTTLFHNLVSNQQADSIVLFRLVRDGAMEIELASRLLPLVQPRAEAPSPPDDLRAPPPVERSPTKHVRKYERTPEDAPIQLPAVRDFVFFIGLLIALGLLILGGVLTLPPPDPHCLGTYRRMVESSNHRPVGAALLRGGGGRGGAWLAWSML